MNQIELLAPAGDLEKLKAAVDYGADAVYFGGEMFSLRAGAGNMSIEEMAEGVSYSHQKGRRAYLTMNIFAHNEDIAALQNYVEKIRNIPFDAFIISDPGVMMILKETFPEAEFHLSTQANLTNYQTALFWYQQGVRRIVLARELTFPEIHEIRNSIPEDMEIEAFVQGAMCISYSGRCLLSNFMIERDANRGACAHPCRWKYSLVEEKRPGEYYPVEEDDRGTYIMNSRDLCMLDHIPELAESGITSFKIEGRMKSAFYVATVVSVYRKALDQYLRNPKDYQFDPAWMKELKKVSHREFTTGFYFNKPTNQDQNYVTSAYTREYSFVGVVKDYDEKTGIAVVEQRNKMSLGDVLEVFGPYTDYFEQKLDWMEDLEGNSLSAAPHPQQILKMKMNQPVKPGFLLRKAK
jgi:putative protease